MLSWIFKLNNYIFKFYGFLYRPPPGNETISISFRYIISFILGGSIMDEYLKQYREMISLRGLTDHTIISYSTYIRAYLNYLSEILHKLPEDVSWAELRDFIRWLQKEKQLSDRTVNHCISQLRFFTMYSPTFDRQVLPFPYLQSLSSNILFHREIFQSFLQPEHLQHKLD